MIKKTNFDFSNLGKGGYFTVDGTNFSVLDIDADPYGGLDLNPKHLSIDIVQQGLESTLQQLRYNREGEFENDFNYVSCPVNLNGNHAELKKFLAEHNKKEVDVLNQKGVDVIITDHHVLPKKLPQASAIVHTTDLCGAGVAWRFCFNIVKRLKSSYQETLIEKLDEKNRETEIARMLSGEKITPEAVAAASRLMNEET